MSTRVDPGLMEDLEAFGLKDASKCFHCSNCTVTCTLSTPENPFPRKLVRHLQLGLKERILRVPEPWLCHACSDCTVHCPRGAKPGEVLGALRQMCIENYAFPPILARMVGDIKFLPALIALPVILFLVWLYGLGLLGVKVAGDLVHKGIAIPEGKVVYSKLFPTLLGVDAIFVPVFFFALCVFGLGVIRFWKDLNEANPWKVKLQGNFIRSLAAVGKDILWHKRFRECETTYGRTLNHFWLVFGFIFLATVTSWAFLREWVFHFDSPYTLFRPPDPLKWLALLGSVLLIFGIYRIYAARQDNAEKAGYGTYYDWQLIYLIAAVGITGALSWAFRLLGSATLAYPTYFLHLVSIFCLFFYAPYTKTAHLVYRTVAMLYARMATGASNPDT
jgi:quinone-modifying oxidoreductase subunit QmoC